MSLKIVPDRKNPLQSSNSSIFCFISSCQINTNSNVSQITKKQCCWSGALRLGFTCKDPSRINPDTLPKYACPDLVSQSGFWAKALPEELSNEGTVIAFWVDKKGRVFYRINNSSPMLFFSGVHVSEPLWALIDIYGLTRGVQLLGELFRETSILWNDVCWKWILAPFSMLGSSGRSVRHSGLLSSSLCCKRCKRIKIPAILFCHPLALISFSHLPL